MALYHVYRPQKFSEIIGQGHIVTTLSNQIKKGSVAHAYLLFGPRGTGKTTTARILAKAMNCKNKKEGEFEPCNECSGCKDITEGRAIDVIEIDAASNTGVDHVREHIIENAQFHPTFLPYKIFIIDEVHMLSTSAFNALLKTLEEPPSHVIFILATTDLEKIPETIVSRCQRFTFHRMEEAEAREYLKGIVKEEKREIDEDVLNKILKKSEGGMRDALSLLDQILAIDAKRLTLENTLLLLPQVKSEDIQKCLSAIEKESVGEILDILHELQEKRTHFVHFSDELIAVLRDVLIEKIQKKSSTSELSIERIFSLIDILLERRGQIRTSPIATLPLEMGFIEWAVPMGEKPRQSLEHSTTVASSPPVKTKENPPVAASALTAPIPVIQAENQASNIIDSTPEIPLLDSEDLSLMSSSPVLEKEPAVPLSAVPGIEFETIQKKWHEVVARVEKGSPSLLIILKSATLVKLEGDTLLLSVPYKFHKAKLSDKTNQRKIEALMSEVYTGMKIHLDVMIDEKEEEKAEAQELAALMGGQVV